MRVSRTLTAVIASLALGAGSAAMAASSASAAGSFTGVSAPKISGVPTVGKPLTAKPDGKTRPSATSKTFQWRRYTAGAWRNISGATKASYSPVASDLGNALRVKVCYKRRGSKTKCVESAKTAKTIAGTFTGLITISGSPRTGSALTALATVSPASTPTWAWYDGPTQVGTDTSYTVPETSAGHVLTLKGTFSQPGYATRTFTSASVTVAASEPFVERALAAFNAARAQARTCGSEGAFAAAPAVGLDPELSAVEQTFAQDRAVAHDDGHISASGDVQDDRAEAAGYSWQSWNAYEGVVAGVSDPTAAVTELLTDPRECADLMNADLTKVGFGAGSSDGFATFAWLGVEPW